MAFKLILAAAALAAGMATLVSNGPSVDAATVATKKICAKVLITGAGQKKGLAGTEKKVRVLAISDWERQARGQLGVRFDSWAASVGQNISCKRSIFTVRCIASSTPCTP